MSDTLKRQLVPSNTIGSACGKAILIGEHAAVDGHPALALPLKDQNLQIVFGETLSHSESDTAWNQCWSLSINDRVQPLPENERERLTRSLERGLQLLTLSSVSINDFMPQHIVIRSRLPLGAGMGGSAALSAALLRGLASALGQNLSAHEISHQANELDGFFHGRASGLDAATVVADSVIRFQKNVGVQSVFNRRGFWILLVDTGERTPTREMVERVAALRSREPHRVEQTFSTLAALAGDCEKALIEGQLYDLGRFLNQAHDCLRRIDVSTELLDCCVQDLRSAGACGAKLTGGGGGGLALGIFENQPTLPLNTRWSGAPHFLTFVPADKRT
jgi:mevalonate kinase